MSRLLIIGASVLQLPAIKKAKELGHYVAVADYNPHAIGIPYADEYYNASTIDIAAITDVALRFRPDGIMTLATDMPMRSVAAATTALGLSGITMETAVKATDKGEMIRTFKEYGVESPWYYVVENNIQLQKILDRLTYPCVIKPTDNAGSRGVMLVENPVQLEPAYNYSLRQSRGGAVIIEEYMQGHEVSVEVIVSDNNINILAVTDKITTGSPYFVEMGHTQQSTLPDEAICKIRDLAIRAVRAVGIDNGPAHVEIMLTATGPKMIELGARMGGDCITTHLVPLSTGIDMMKATIDISLGLRPDITPKFDMGSAIRYIHAEPGRVESIYGVEQAQRIPGIKEVVLQFGPGDIIPEIHSSIDRVGFVISQGRSAEDAAEICNHALKQIEIKRC